MSDGVHFERVKKGDRPSAKQQNQVLSLLEALAAGGIADSVTGGDGTFVLSRPRGGSGTTLKIFEVQSAAGKDGVYNCYEQTLDATEWADTAGDDHFDDKDTTSVEVFNLYENDVVASYTPALCLYDRLACWQWTDDEGTKRYVGIPLTPQVRWVKATAAAGATTTVVCNVMLNDYGEAGSGELGYNITVNGSICGGGNLNAAVPRIASGDWLLAQNLYGEWYFLTQFAASEDCDCYSAP